MSTVLPEPAAQDELSRLRHDLRTPLAVASGFAELLAGERPVSDAERRAFAQRILEAAAELRALLDGRPAA